VHRRRRVLLTLLLLVALVTAACSSGGGSTRGAGSTTPTSAGPPKSGGRLVIGVEAESDGFDLTKNRPAASGTVVFRAIYDQLYVFDKYDKPQPSLATGAEHNADFTEWTIHVRAGVTFQDGTPLDAAAVQGNIQAIKSSALTGPLLNPIVGVDVVDPLSVRVRLNSALPAFPSYTATALGTIQAPAMRKDPDSGRHPIGTGPYRLKSWTPGSSLVLARNPNYWRKGLPYFDEIEIRPIPDAHSRLSALRAGDVDMIHTSDGQSIADLRKETSLQVQEEKTGETEEGFVMLNTGKPPFDDIRLRKALALATNPQQVIDIAGAGVGTTADGPWAPGSPWYTPTGYPKMDVAQARSLVQQIKAEKGAVNIELKATADPATLQVAQLLKDQWSQVGITTSIKQVEQSQYILDALKGDYQGILWRQFGARDPDLEYPWWNSKYAAPEGALALNFARHASKQIDDAQEQGRHSDDPAVRKAAYATVGRVLAEDLPYVWLSHTVWALAAKPDIHGLGGGTEVDGSAATGPDNGSFSVAELWRG
jgi:peptide/nickel transport system substrate-binding protein